ncbi:MAG: hypothetical protein COB02_00380 [Candidatus Cloacimonadota bacterium]|nr:MAG: hypothetical protein COB02_00380 [Candidatus Cloacimonadota bacterium]
MSNLNLDKIYKNEINERIKSPGKGNIYDSETKNKNIRATSYSFGCSNLHPHIKPIIEHSNIKSILDFGCGSGSDLILLNESYPSLDFFGYDPCIEMIEHANSLKQSQNIQFSSQDLLTQSFDLIISNASIHLLKKQNEIIQNIYSHLSGNGIFLSGEFVCSSSEIKFSEDLFNNQKTPLLFQNISQQEIFIQYFFDAGFEEVEVLERKVFDPSPHILNSLNPNINSSNFRYSLINTQFYIIIIQASKELKATPLAFQCSNCQMLHQDKIYRSINKQTHQSLYKKLLLGEINLSECPHCKTMQFTAPFQVHDMKSQKMAFCFPKSMEIQQKQLQNEILTPFLQRLPHYEMELFFNHSSFINFMD